MKNKKKIEYISVYFNQNKFIIKGSDKTEVERQVNELSKMNFYGNIKELSWWFRTPKVKYVAKLTRY